MEKPNVSRERVSVQYIYTEITTRADPWIQFRSFIRRAISRKLELTNSVDVVFAVVGIVIVDDKLNVVHIESSGSDVGGDEDGGAASLELAEHPLPLLLLLVPVDAHRWPAVFPHQPFQNKYVKVKSKSNYYGVCQGESQACAVIK